MSGYYIWTIGCQMNKADSEHMACTLERAGYSPAPQAEQADIVVLNSCVVRGSAETRVVNRLNSLKGLKKKCPAVTIALTGCMVDSRVDDLRRRFPWVDIFFQPQQWQGLEDWISERESSDSAQRGGAATPPGGTVAAFVPVIHGCDNFCAYCVVPYRRGRARSRPLTEICSEVEALVERGVKEVTLLGQIVDLYGNDLPSGPDLAGLLAELNRMAGLERIRFLTNHPNHMSPRLIGAVADLDKVCEHISLPVQAGDDAILSLMRRGYTADQYRRLVTDIRRRVPGICLSTDVIVGFPGETEEQFARTANLLSELRFDKVHIAAYSPRPDTIASRKMEDDVSREQKESRRGRLEAMQLRIAGEINAGLVYGKVEVLVEGLKGGRWWGRTRGDKLVFFPGNPDLVGRLVPVRVDKSSPVALQGMPV
ncbi:MAG: tRNA (N6-isopentenyl adenosine(37)-C2)-methylthiotransferase MiaB [Chloroflexi bacterium]|nr:tRNA (N6-isopentenyl adenosine(37)-C2)-methylthiotransferase MiaB [Chloroflexota bacterium]